MIYVDYYDYENLSDRKQFIARSSTRLWTRNTISAPEKLVFVEFLMLLIHDFPDEEILITSYDASNAAVKAIVTNPTYNVDGVS